MLAAAGAEQRRRETSATRATDFGSSRFRNLIVDENDVEPYDDAIGRSNDRRFARFERLFRSTIAESDPTGSERVREEKHFEQVRKQLPPSNELPQFLARAAQYYNTTLLGQVVAGADAPPPPASNDVFLFETLLADGPVTEVPGQRFDLAGVYSDYEVDFLARRYKAITENQNAKTMRVPGWLATAGGFFAGGAVASMGLVGYFYVHNLTAAKDAQLNSLFGAAGSLLSTPYAPSIAFDVVCLTATFVSGTLKGEPVTRQTVANLLKTGVKYGSIFVTGVLIAGSAPMSVPATIACQVVVNLVTGRIITPFVDVLLRVDDEEKARASLQYDAMRQSLEREREFEQTVAFLAKYQTPAEGLRALQREDEQRLDRATRKSSLFDGTLQMLKDPKTAGSVLASVAALIVGGAVKTGMLPSILQAFVPDTLFREQAKKLYYTLMWEKLYPYALGIVLQQLVSKQLGRFPFLRRSIADNAIGRKVKATLETIAGKQFEDEITYEHVFYALFFESANVAGRRYLSTLETWTAKELGQYTERLSLYAAAAMKSGDYAALFNPALVLDTLKAMPLPADMVGRSLKNADGVPLLTFISERFVNLTPEAFAAYPSLSEQFALREGVDVLKLPTTFINSTFLFGQDFGQRVNVRYPVEYTEIALSIFDPAKAAPAGTAPSGTAVQGARQLDELLGASQSLQATFTGSRGAYARGVALQSGAILFDEQGTPMYALAQDGTDAKQLGQIRAVPLEPVQLSQSETEQGSLRQPLSAEQRKNAVLLDARNFFVRTQSEIGLPSFLPVASATVPLHPPIVPMQFPHTLATVEPGEVLYTPEGKAVAQVEVNPADEKHTYYRSVAASGGKLIQVGQNDLDRFFVLRKYENKPAEQGLLLPARFTDLVERAPQRVPLSQSLSATIAESVRLGYPKEEIAKFIQQLTSIEAKFAADVAEVDKAQRDGQEKLATYRDNAKLTLAALQAESGIAPVNVTEADRLFAAVNSIQWSEKDENARALRQRLALYADQRKQFDAASAELRRSSDAFEAYTKQAGYYERTVGSKEWALLEQAKKTSESSVGALKQQLLETVDTVQGEAQRTLQNQINVLAPQRAAQMEKDFAKIRKDLVVAQDKIRAQLRTHHSDLVKWIDAKTLSNEQGSLSKSLLGSQATIPGTPPLDVKATGDIVASSFTVAQGALQGMHRALPSSAAAAVAREQQTQERVERDRHIADYQERAKNIDAVKMQSERMLAQQQKTISAEDRALAQRLVKEYATMNAFFSAFKTAESLAFLQATALAFTNPSGVDPTKTPSLDMKGLFDEYDKSMSDLKSRMGNLWTDTVQSCFTRGVIIDKERSHAEKRLFVIDGNGKEAAECEGYFHKALGPYILDISLNFARGASLWTSWSIPGLILGRFLNLIPEFVSVVTQANETFLAAGAVSADGIVSGTAKTDPIRYQIALFARQVLCSITTARPRGCVDKFILAHYSTGALAASMLKSSASDAAQLQATITDTSTFAKYLGRLAQPDVTYVELAQILWWLTYYFGKLLVLHGSADLLFGNEESSDVRQQFASAEKLRAALPESESAFTFYTKRWLFPLRNELDDAAKTFFESVWNLGLSMKDVLVWMFGSDGATPPPVAEGGAIPTTAPPPPPPVMQ